MTKGTFGPSLSRVMSLSLSSTLIVLCTGQSRIANLRPRTSLSDVTWAGASFFDAVEMHSKDLVIRPKRKSILDLQKRAGLTENNIPDFRTYGSSSTSSTSSSGMKLFSANQRIYTTNDGDAGKKSRLQQFLVNFFTNFLEDAEHRVSNFLKFLWTIFSNIFIKPFKLLVGKINNKKGDHENDNDTLDDILGPSSSRHNHADGDDNDDHLTGTDSWEDPPGSSLVNKEQARLERAKNFAKDRLKQIENVKFSNIQLTDDQKKRINDLQPTERKSYWPDAATKSRNQLSRPKFVAPIPAAPAVPAVPQQAATAVAINESAARLPAEPSVTAAVSATTALTAPAATPTLPTAVSAGDASNKPADTGAVDEVEVSEEELITEIDHLLEKAVISEGFPFDKEDDEEPGDKKLSFATTASSESSGSSSTGGSIIAPPAAAAVTTTASSVTADASQKAETTVTAAPVATSSDNVKSKSFSYWPDAFHATKARLGFSSAVETGSKTVEEAPIPAQQKATTTFEVVGNIIASVKNKTVAMTKSPAPLPASFLLGTWRLTEQRYLEGEMGDISETMLDLITFPAYGSTLASTTPGSRGEGWSLTVGDDGNNYLELTILRGCKHTEWAKDRAGKPQAKVVHPPPLPHDQKPTSCVYRGDILGNRIIGYVYATDAASTSGSKKRERRVGTFQMGKVADSYV